MNKPQHRLPSRALALVSGISAAVYTFVGSYTNSSIILVFAIILASLSIYWTIAYIIYNRVRIAFFELQDKIFFDGVTYHNKSKELASKGDVHGAEMELIKAQLLMSVYNDITAIKKKAYKGEQE